MVDDTKSRKWQITINNPVEKGFTHDAIVEILGKFKGCTYYCLSDEVGESGTFHTHIFIYSPSGVRFSTIKNRFEGGHFDMANGNCQQNRDYIFKEGKWLNDKKCDTNIRDSHVEWGDLPVERQGKRNDLDDLYDMIVSGASDADIYLIDPNYIKYSGMIERVRQSVLLNKYRSVRRLDLRVTYVYGSTQAGKTRSIMDGFGDENVYRVVDYRHPFDGYQGEDVVVFEEFRSSLPLGMMLNYLDVYPCQLPARYCNKMAAYTKVFIVSNLELSDQYQDIQRKHPEDYKAFLRRIHYVELHTQHKIFSYTLDQFQSSWVPAIHTPFGFDYKVV